MDAETEQPIVIHPEVTGSDALPDDAGDGTARVPVVRGPDRRRGGNAAAVITRDDEPSPPPPELAAPSKKRAYALDALRGLFLISMTMGFTIGSEHWPLWMYHRQMPPPGETLVDVPGISWRDLAYAAFLFTMAAALPLTMSRRIDKGETEIGIVFAGVRRYAMLLIYALLIGHSNTYFIGYTQTGRLLAVAGFIVMALVFTRRREDWDETRYRWVNRAGWALAVAFLALSPLAYGQTFAFTRIDDIIAGLAFASLAGIVIWYFTRNNPTARLVVLGVAVALYLGAKQEGWVQDWWYSSPVEWAFAPSRFSLLTVVIPGTLAGDAILRWMRARGVESATGWGRTRLTVLAILSAILTPIVVAGMYNRWVQPTTQIALALLIGGLFLTWRPTRPVEQMLRSLFLLGAVWLSLGLFLEPSEGGIKKVPETLSYFFTVTGLTTLLLVALTTWIDALGHRKSITALVDVGHNPLLMYVLYTVLINSLLELTPVGRTLLLGSVGEELLRSLICLVAVVLIVRAVSRRRIYWRT